jgi:hypothetical protein
VFAQLALSGEPLIPELKSVFGDVLGTPVPLLDFDNSSLLLKDFWSHYQNYWRSTSTLAL